MVFKGNDAIKLSELNMSKSTAFPSVLLPATRSQCSFIAHSSSMKEPLLEPSEMTKRAGRSLLAIQFKLDTNNARTALLPNSHICLQD